MSEDSNKNDKKLDLNKVEEPTTDYSLEKIETDDSQLHPVLIQLLQKSIKEADEGKTYTHEEVMRITKKKYPFLK